MKKFAFVVLAIIGMAVITGCRAEGEIDTHGSSNVPAMR